MTTAMTQHWTFRRIFFILPEYRIISCHILISHFSVLLWLWSLLLLLCVRFCMHNPVRVMANRERQHKGKKSLFRLVDSRLKRVKFLKLIVLRICAFAVQRHFFCRCFFFIAKFEANNLLLFPQYWIQRSDWFSDFLKKKLRTNGDALLF